MGVPNNNFHDLERQRRELEGNVRKLQESLYHWRTWEAEYDGLKDEINDLYDDATTDEFLRIGRDFGGYLVNEEEVKVILGAKQGFTRSKEQAVNLITRRIDYVKENVQIMEKRLSTADDQLQALDSVGRAPLELSGDFPTTEIMEELDEEENVISSSTQAPGSQAPELLDILKKAGVRDIPDVPKKDASEDTKPASGTVEEVTEESSSDETKGEWQPSVTRQESRPSRESKSTQPSRKPQPDLPKPMPAPAKRSEHSEEHPVTEVDEPPEDAELRREMLEYGLNEIGAVVAELELDETGSDVDLDSYGSYDDYDEDEEEEDEFGRSKGPALSEDYHRQMRELEEKLNARGMWNVGSDTGTLPADMQQDLERPQVVKVEKPDNEKAQSVSGKGKQKKVAFAEGLDIAPAPEPAPEKATLPPQQPDLPTMSDSIVERAGPTAKTSGPSEPPKKVSRFKSARSSMAKDNPSSETTASSTGPAPSQQPPRVHPTAPKIGPSPSLPIFPAKPSEPKPFSQPISDVFELEKQPTPQSHSQPPSDRITADKLVERDVKEGKATAPEPDELDEQIHKREIASEFYRMRNRMVQQNEGFVDNEPEIVPLGTENAPKKVSRFKAARTR